MICYEGDPATHLYVIQRGSVVVLVNRPGGKREPVARAGAGEWFGERALFSSRARSATVVASEDTELWSLSKEKFDTLLKKNPA